MALTPPSTLPAYILAGGHNSRFGSDKALALLGNKPLITHVADQIRPSVSSITVVADQPDKYQSLGLTTIADRQPHLGPMGGLLTALEHAADAQWLLLASCDAVILDITLLDQLLKERHCAPGVIAFKGDYWETMPALYHLSILPTVRESLHLGQRAIWRLIESVPHKMLRYPADHPLIAQINTPEDLQQFRLTQPSEN